MTNPICSVKHKLDSAIQQLCNVSWMFVKDSLRDFTRNRKLSFRTVISILLSMEQQGERTHAGDEKRAIEKRNQERNRQRDLERDLTHDLSR